MSEVPHNRAEDVVVYKEDDPAASPEELRNLLGALTESYLGEIRFYLELEPDQDINHRSRTLANETGQTTELHLKTTNKKLQLQVGQGNEAEELSVGDSDAQQTIPELTRVTSLLFDVVKNLRLDRNPSFQANESTD